MPPFLQALLESDRLWAAVAALGAVASAVIALGETRARARDAKQYSQALEAVIDAGQYVVHLRGMEARMTSLNLQFDQLGEIVLRLSGHMKDTADATRGMVSLATKHIEGALANIERATLAVDGISRSLNDIASAARRSQRDSLRAHEEFLRELGARKAVTKACNLDDPSPT